MLLHVFTYIICLCVIQLCYSQTLDRRTVNLSVFPDVHFASSDDCVTVQGRQRPSGCRFRPPPAFPLLQATATAAGIRPARCICSWRGRGLTLTPLFFSSFVHLTVPVSVGVMLSPAGAAGGVVFCWLGQTHAGGGEFAAFSSRQFKILCFAHLQRAKQCWSLSRFLLNLTHNCDTTLTYFT